MELQDLADWMKLNGVRRARLTDGTELEFSGNVVYGVPAEKREPTAEERAKSDLDKRRERYRKEFGYTPSDDQLRHLP